MPRRNRNATAHDRSTASTPYSLFALRRQAGEIGAQGPIREAASILARQIIGA
jgi:hypothetical protein